MVPNDNESSPTTVIYRNEIIHYLSDAYRELEDEFMATTRFDAMIADLTARKARATSHMTDLKQRIQRLEDLLKKTKVKLDPVLKCPCP